MEKRVNFKFYFEMFAIFFVFILFAGIVFGAQPSFNPSGTTSYLKVGQSPIFTYNFTANVTNPDNSTLTFSIRNISSTLHGAQPVSFFTWFSLDSSTGILTVNPVNNNQSGNYNLSVEVLDSNTLGQISPFYFVINESLFPYFRYVCDNERSAVEDTPFGCYINVTDGDETGNINISSNYSWFKFNSTNGNSVLVPGDNFNFSTRVNFTSDDSSVGNWSVNITAKDSLNQSNSTIITFYVSNSNDSVSLQSINNLTLYTTGNYSFYVNASDDDLLIPDKSVYNEILTFSSNESWASVSNIGQITGTNKSRALIFINSALAPIGNSSVNISVRDANNYSFDSKIFIVQIINNSAPIWDSNTITNYSLNEDENFYLNISGNVSDLDSDSISFYYMNNSYFPSFSLNRTTGVINFTPNDFDVGSQIVIINASDGKTNSSKTFNFTISNVQDNLSFQDSPVLISSNANASVDSNSNVVTDEDNQTSLYFFVQDNDLRILQKSFYNESLSVTTSIQGVNTSLLSFVKDSAFPTASPTEFSNRSRFLTTFTPKKADIGTYNITVNVTDRTNQSISLSFNITISEINHIPSLSGVENQSISFSESIYLDFDSEDIEDGNESSGNLTYSLSNLSVGGNFLTINETTGVINFTFNQSYTGFWNYNVSVNDSTGKYNSQIMGVKVYDYPEFVYPLTAQEFTLVENQSYLFNFSINDSVGILSNEYMNYSLYLNNSLRNSTLGNGNVTNYSWAFTPSFSDYTCGGFGILGLNVSNAKLSNYSSWNVTIENTEYPLRFYSNVSNQVGAGSVTLTLSDYFEDYDASDYCINQTVGFSYNLISTSGGAQSIEINNWTNAEIPSISFSASESGESTYNLVAFEYNASNVSQLIRNVSSNNFSISIAVASSTSSSGGGGGGGGSSSTKPVSLKLIVPGIISSDLNDKLVVPIRLLNDGTSALNNIILDSKILKNGLDRPDIKMTFDQGTISRIESGKSQDVNLVVDIDVNDQGTYDLIINASVLSPSYKDSAIIQINVKEGKKIEERILFTEELILGNPECIEIKETLDEARTYFINGDLVNSERLVGEALESCKNAIAKRNSAESENKLSNQLLSYVAFASLAGFGIGMGYYYYRRLRLQRTMEGY